MREINVLIERNESNVAVVSSRTIAEQLGKEHARVIRDIKDKALSDFADWFIPSKYLASNGQQYDEYLLTKNGFTMLVFNYNGYLDFKKAYIDKFNEMENAIKSSDLLGIMRSRDKDEVIQVALELTVIVKELEEEVVELKEDIVSLETLIKEKDYDMELLLKDIPLAEKRTRLVQLIRGIRSEPENFSFTIAKRYDLLYDEFARINHINLKLMAKKHKISPIEYIDSHLGKIDELYDLFFKMFKGDVDRYAENYFGSMVRDSLIDYNTSKTEPKTE